MTYIVLEGPDSCGKTTQAKMLVDRLNREGRPAIFTKEPGSLDPICQDIRHLLLKPSQLDDDAAFLLFWADRIQHQRRIVEPALDANTIVVSDRSYISGVIYHGLMSSSTHLIRELIFFAQRAQPDICFVGNASYETAANLMSVRARDRIESKPEHFHRQLHDSFNTLMNPESFIRKFLSETLAPRAFYQMPELATHNPEQTHDRIWSYLNETP